jgi:hypothetical protein
MKYFLSILFIILIIPCYADISDIPDISLYNGLYIITVLPVVIWIFNLIIFIKAIKKKNSNKYFFWITQVLSILLIFLSLDAVKDSFPGEYNSGKSSFTFIGLVILPFFFSTYSLYFRLYENTKREEQNLKLPTTLTYFIIAYISIGLSLSSIIKVEYICVGQNLLLEYTGGPFVFKLKDPNGSMANYYSVLGIIKNSIIWVSLILILRQIALKLTNKEIKNDTLIFYKTIIFGFFMFATINIFINYIKIGKGFASYRNYWYFDVDEKEKKWELDCKCNSSIFGS